MRTLELAQAEALGCSACKLCSTRTQVVYGSGTTAARLMFIGEGPGKDEDEQGQPFVGRSGQLLMRLLNEELGLGRDDVYIGNVVKCRPPNNRDPEPDEIAACSHWLEEQIEFVQPDVIVSLGNFSTKLLMNTKTGITKLRGEVYDWKSGRGYVTKLVPTFHPSAALQGGGADVVVKIRADLVRAGGVLDGCVGQ